ncbi:MAG: HD domain-containing protein [Pseudomonadales bacterium]|jgi:putative hydrolase of HD superfamily|nr:HD domain-containing protein [Pseudomonadales bacterium]
MKLEKAAIPIALLGEEVAPLISAWFELVHLKQLFRKGWLERGIPQDRCESVAEHTFGNALLCILLADQFPQLEGEKVLRMALLHDIGEAYVGDITPQNRVNSADKSERELRAVETILGKLPNGQRLIADWHEYEHQSSPEARFVKQIDRLELAMQATVYKCQGLIDPEDFMASAERHLEEPVFKDILSALRGLG